MEAKLDLPGEIKTAMRLQGCSLYRLAKMLGYKNVSPIYAVSRGRRGLSNVKLLRLLALSGKLRT